MNTHIQNRLSLIALAVVFTLSWGTAYADDLNPPPYRGGPLSVHAHWQLTPGTTTLNLVSPPVWVDDNDPSTVLHPAAFSDPVGPNTANQYQFQLPNWIDTLPIKYMRVQLTWINTPQLPISITSSALDGANLIQGSLVYASAPQIIAAINGVYQYYDFIFKPNPDVERIDIQLPANAVLWQTVVDTVSTVPEPATLVMLGLGALSLIRHRRRSVV